MKHLKACFFGAAFVLGLASAPLFAQDSAAGTWEVTMETPQGANSVTLTLKVDGTKASADLASAMGTMPMTGTATGGAIVLTGSLDIQGMSIQLGLNGKVDGQTFNGTVKMGDFGEFPFTGKRAGGATAAAAPTPAAAPAAASTAGAGAAGKWNVTLMLAGMGEFAMTADLKQTGSDITGTLNSVAGDVTVKGTMTGSTLKLEFTAETPQGPLPVTMTGELGAAGFAGKASIAGMGEADWKAVRGQ